MEHLPPLPWLRSFVAVIETGRLARAAEVLHLTDSAVSHHLRRLEDALRARLVHRGAGGCAPTEAGERLYPRAREALALLESGVRDVTGHGDGKVTLTLPRAFATHWLVPRFPRLSRGGEAPELQLLPTTRVCDLERERIDLGIRLGNGQWPDTEARELMAQRVCPLAPPALAHEYRRLGWEETVAQAAVVANATHPTEWADWCHASGHAPVPGPALALESFDLVLQAGLAGSGLIMGRTPMVDDAIARGDLVAPFPHWVASEARYYLVWPERHPPLRGANTIRQWLVELAAEADDDHAVSSGP